MMKLTFFTIHIFLNMATFAQGHVEILELGNFKFIPALKISADTPISYSQRLGMVEKFLRAHELLPLEVSGYSLFFRTEDERKMAMGYFSENYQPNHLFYNLNKFGVDLIPGKLDSIVGPLVELSGCSLDDMRQQLECLQNYGKQQPIPIVFFREYIAELTLLANCYFLKRYPGMTYQLLLEDSTYIPGVILDGQKTLLDELDVYRSF